jgi:hypothetical protein
MKQDTDWNTVSTSYDPLKLYQLIERTVLEQIEDQYPFATVYDQELSFYSFQKDIFSTRSGMNDLTPISMLVEPSG